MSSANHIPDGKPALAPEAREHAIGTLLSLQGITASPAELRSASRAWQRLNPQAATTPPARASS